MMPRFLNTSILSCFACLACADLLAGQSPSAQPLPLVLDGRPACTLVYSRIEGDEWLIRHALEAVLEPVQRWSSVRLPEFQVDEGTVSLPEGPLVVLTTASRLSHIPVLADLGSKTDRAGLLLASGFTDEQGFACLSADNRGTPAMLILAPSSRGLYNAAIWTGDFAIDGTRENLVLHREPVARTPQLGGRAAYLLNIWGREALYTADDWTTIFDSFARDGFDRVYFWMSGHFPSQKYPQTYRCKNSAFDSTEQSGIPTIEDQQRVIRAGHERGLKVYLGGAMGGWCCTYLLTNLQPGTTKTRPEKSQYGGANSLCPSHPESRKALIEYYEEMFDALPEADGVFIESADEWGDCICPECSRPIDSLGSRQFGQAQITLLQEIMRAIWRRHPHARACYTIGYEEHRSDPAYYRLIRSMNDPRIEWMEARDSWAFPGPDGNGRPARWFSHQVMRWRQYYALPLDSLIADANRVDADGMYGLITAFEPGAGTGDYHTQIPYPTGIMPYVLTGFAWREMTWSPATSREDLLKQTQRRFFGRQAPSHLAEDLWTIREIIRTSHGSKKLTTGNQSKIEAIAKHIEESRPQADAKTAEGLDLMHRALSELRQHIEANAKGS